MTEQEARFDEFWGLYPKREGKKPAKKVWEKIAPDDVLFKEIIASVEAHKRLSKKWKEGYVPMPTTWLNQERWEDDFERVVYPGFCAIANKENLVSVWDRIGIDQEAWEQRHRSTWEDIEAMPPDRLRAALDWVGCMGDPKWVKRARQILEFNSA